MSSKKTNEIITNPTEFFMDEIKKAMAKQSTKIEKEIEFYLVELLKQFMLSDNLFTTNEDGKKENLTLALTYAQALYSTDQARKIEDLKKLGDTSLYVAGFFPDSINRKPIQVDYYVGMGSNAYHSISNIISDVSFRKLYSKLASNFIKCVDLLSEISSASFVQDTNNILRTYDLWLKTGSERAEKQLREAGIIPNEHIKSNIQ